MDTRSLLQLELAYLQSNLSPWEKLAILYTIYFHYIQY